MARTAPFPEEAIEQLREFLGHTDPRLVTTERAAELVDSFSQLERLAAAGRLRFTRRACESTNWAAEGHRSPASWLAEKSKSSMGEAISVLETAERLERLEETTKAMCRGDLSLSQLKQLTPAAAKDPSRESELVRAAGAETFNSLRARSRQIRLRASSAQEEAERYKAIHAGRYCRHWNDEEGALRLEARLAPDAGARLLSSLEAEADVFFDRARKAGDQESPQVYKADALVALVTGRTGSRASNDSSRRAGGPRTDTVVVRVDASALRRGYAKGDELCQIAGVGPVPVAIARRILGDAFLKIVIRDAVDVLSVCHVGRGVPAHVQTALEERDPGCVICGSTHGLENHHFVEDFAKCRTTSLTGLARVCARHHDRITYDGFKLTGAPGAWRLVPPPAAFDSS